MSSATATKIVNRLDRERLLPHLGAPEFSSPQALYLRWLLSNSRVVAPEKVPAHIVTMNSKVRLRDEQRDEEEVLTLAYPDDSGYAKDRVSVLSPIGAALLGCREGEQVGLVGSRASRALVLEKIEYQPERDGEYSL